MGVITRFVDIFSSNINAVLDKAEKPEQMLRMLVQEMEEALVEVRSHAAQVIADKKQYERKMDNINARIVDWQNKAEMALSKDREDLARKALVEKSEAEQEAVSLQSQLDQINESLETITADANGLQTKLNEARQKQQAMARRQETAIVQLASRKSVTSSKMDDVQQRYERLHQKVTSLESQVEAYDRTTPVSLMDEFRALESSSKVDEELMALKKKVANG